MSSLASVCSRCVATVQWEDEVTRPFGEDHRSAAVRDVERLAEPIARSGALVGAAQCGAEIGERDRVMKPDRSRCENPSGIAQVLDRGLATVYLGGAAQCPCE